MAQVTDSNNTTLIAIVVVAFVAIAGFFAYQNGMFGERDKDGVNLEINAN